MLKEHLHLWFLSFWRVQRLSSGYVLVLRFHRGEASVSGAAGGQSSLLCSYFSYRLVVWGNLLSLKNTAEHCKLDRTILSRFCGSRGTLTYTHHIADKYCLWYCFVWRKWKWVGRVYIKHKYHKLFSLRNWILSSTGPLRTFHPRAWSARKENANALRQKKLNWFERLEYLCVVVTEWIWRPCRAETSGESGYIRHLKLWQEVRIFFSLYVGTF